MAIVCNAERYLAAEVIWKTLEARAKQRQKGPPTMYPHQSPDNTDPGIEREIIAKGKTAPRVTPADIEDAISCEFTFNVGAMLRDCPTHESLRLLTICVLVLQNGFTVTGESACASPENFDAEIGRKIARANAVQRCWPLLGYALRDKLAAATAPPTTTIGAPP